MALISCSECGNSISDKAECCPKCGYKLNSNQISTSSNTVTTKKDYTKTILILIISFFITGCIIAILSDNNDKPSSYQSYSYDDYYSYTPKTGKAGALEKAKSYLNSSAFSYSGLIDQLEYHGFSNAEATYAVDNCGANWKAQALKKAKSYLRSSAFSYEGLIDQLEYNGFTSDEAKYGADNCGADWNEQALKKANSYLRSSSNWTKTKLIDQLEYSGFTYSQAKYGVEHSNLN